MTKQKTEIEAKIAEAAAGMVNAEAGLKLFGFDVSQEGTWQTISERFAKELLVFMQEEDAKNQQEWDKIIEDLDLDLSSQPQQQVTQMPQKPQKPPMPTVREIALARLREAGEAGTRAKTIREYVQNTYGVEIHEKTVGMTLYRLFKDGLVRRDGHVWFFAPHYAETKNPGVAAPGL